jgi:hypothetical protein
VSAQSHATRTDDVTYHGDFNGADAWWTVDSYLRGGVHHGKSKKNKNEEDTWDLSDSLADLYMGNHHDMLHHLFLWHEIEQTRDW